MSRILSLFPIVLLATLLLIVGQFVAIRASNENPVVAPSVSESNSSASVPEAASVQSEPTPVNEPEEKKPLKAPQATSADIQRGQAFRCGVCNHIVNKFFEKINEAKVEHPYKVQTRYRLDEKKLVDYAYSEPFLYSVIDADHAKSWWGEVGFVRSAQPPIRLVTDKGTSTESEDITRLGVFEGPAMDKIRTTWKKLHKELVEESDEQLIEILKNGENSIDDVKRLFCVKLIKGCPAWPMTWNPPTDSLEPTPKLRTEL